MNKGKSNTNLKLISGIITFIYCFEPILQAYIFNDFSDRFNSHYFFVISSSLYQIMEFIYTNTIVPYIAQFFLWLSMWFVVYLFIKIIIMKIRPH